MIKALSDFHFLRPFWLILLLLAISIAIDWPKKFLNIKYNNLTKYIDQHLLPFLLKNNNTNYNIKKSRYFLSFFLLLISLSLAGPTFRKFSVNEYFLKPPIIILLEASEDMQSTDVSPSRFKRALFKINDLLKLLDGGQAALIAFAGDAHIVVPITNDFNTLQMLQNELSPQIMPIKGVFLKPALEIAAEMLKDFAKGQILVLGSSRLDDNPQNLKEFLSSKVKNPITYISFATKEGAPLIENDGNFSKNSQGQIIFSKLNDNNLKFLQENKVNSLIFSNNNTDINHIDNYLSNKSSKTSGNYIYENWQDCGPYILILAVLLFTYMIFFSKTNLIFFLLLLSVIPLNLRANYFSDMWLRKDQKDYKILLEGSKAYKSGQFKEAIEKFNKVDSLEGKYNLGNAYAKDNQIEKAIFTYEEVLKQNPQHEDAKFNKELLEKLKKEQENQKSNEENKDENQKDKEDQENQESNKENKNNESENKDESNKDKQNDDNKDSQKKDQDKENNQPKNNKDIDKNIEEKENKTKKAAQEKDEELDKNSQYLLDQVKLQNESYLRRKFNEESKGRKND